MVHRYSPGAAGGPDVVVGAGASGAVGFAGGAWVAGGVPGSPEGSVSAPGVVGAAGRQTAGPPPAGIVQVKLPGRAFQREPGIGAVQVEGPPPAGTWQRRVPGSSAKSTAGSGSPTGRHNAEPESDTTQASAGILVTPSAAEQYIVPATSVVEAIAPDG